MALERDNGLDYSWEDLVDDYSEEEMLAAYGVMKDKCWEKAFDQYKEFADRYRIGYWSKRQKKAMKQDLERMHEWIDKALCRSSGEEFEFSMFDVHGHGILLDKDLEGYNDFRKNIKDIEEIDI